MEYKRYSEAFKLTVVREIAEGRWRGPLEAAEAYRVSWSAVARWMETYGYGHLRKRVVRVDTKGERDELKRTTEGRRERDGGDRKAMSEPSSFVSAVFNQLSPGVHRRTFPVPVIAPLSLVIACPRYRSLSLWTRKSRQRSLPDLQIFKSAGRGALSGADGGAVYESGNQPAARLRREKTRG